MTQTNPRPHKNEIATDGRAPTDGQGHTQTSNTQDRSTDTGQAQRPATNPAYENAVWLARDYHLRVYPVHRWRNESCSCEAGPRCDHGGKHPVYAAWDELATDHLEQLARWHERHPDANWAVLGDRVTLLEADGVRAEGGKVSQTPRQCIPDDLWQSAGFIIRSGGGGYHVAHANPSKGPKPGNWVRVMPGVDTRGARGGSILPGSTSYKGEYTWEREPGSVPFTPFPTRLAERLSGTQKRNRARLREDLKGGGPIPEGTRDESLFQIAGDLWDNGMEADELLVTLLEINRARCKPPLPEHIVRQKVERRIKLPRKSRENATVEDVSRYQEPFFAAEMIRFTISGYARRVAVNFADHLCYVAQWGWCSYQGGRWARDIGDLEASHIVKRTITLSAAWAALPEQCERWGTDIGRKLWFKGTTLACNTVPQIVQNARSEPELRAHAEQFDADPWLLNTPEGVLDLKRPGTLLAHSPKLRHAKQTGAHYDPQAICPTWLRFLSSTFRDDQELIDYLQMVLAYAMTGDTSEQIWFLLVGRKGRNGKGTLIETMRAVLGDYVVPLDINVLLAKGQNKDGNAPKPALAALVNARMATSQEPDGGMDDRMKWNLAMLKDLTGQDILQIRDLYGKSFAFAPMVKLFVSVNAVPETAEHSAAVWDRIVPLPFTRYFADEERDKGLRDKLKAEASGILNWLLDGLTRLLKLRASGKSLSHPAVLPQAVRAEKRGEQERDDEYASFFNDILVYDANPDAHVLLKDAWKAFQEWRKALYELDRCSAPMPISGDRQFAALAEKRGYPKRRTRQNLTALYSCRLATTTTSSPVEDDGDDGHATTLSANSPVDENAYTDVHEKPGGTSIISSAPIAILHDFRTLVDELLARTDAPVCFDLETNGLNPETNQIVAMQLHQEGGPSAVVDWRRSDVTWQEELRRLVRGVKLVGHNLSFDLAMLIGQEGITRRDLTVAHDTMLAEQVIHGARTSMSDESGVSVSKTYSLAAVAEAYGLTVDKTEQTSWLTYTRGSAAWNEPFTREQVAYALRDVTILPAIMAAQRERLDETGQQAVADLEHRILPVMADTRAHGPWVDRELWLSISADEAPRVKVVAAKARDLLGTPDINLNSQPQVMRALMDIGVEVENTREKTLEQVRDAVPAVAALLDYRALAKSESVYGPTWLDKHVSPSGRVHANWQQIGTETGRMTCSKPCLPQVPKDDHRKAIAAAPGHTLLISDFSNAELRIAAFCSGDEAMITAFRDGRDLHADTARAIFGLGPDDDGRTPDSFSPGKTFRDVAKTVNFALIYGSTAWGLCYNLGLDPHNKDELKRVEDMIGGHRERYPRLWAWLEANQQNGVACGYAVTPLGRRRYFHLPPKPPWIADPREYHQKYGKAFNEVKRQASNHPVQGACADIFKMTVALLNEAVEPEMMHIAVFVYDELVIEVPDEYLDLVEATLKRAIVQAGEWAEVPFPEPEVVRSHHWCKA